MGTTALVIMTIAAVSIWGGLIYSIVHLAKNPDIDLSQVPSDQ